MNGKTQYSKDDILLEAKGLRLYYPIKRGLLGRTVGRVKAVDDVALFVRNGETLGLVGESGCGKSSLGRTLLRLEEPTAGYILFEGQNILDYDRQQMRLLRRQMQIIFQDPYSSLDPRKTVGKIIEEPFKIHNIGDRRQRLERVVQLMELVGLRPEHYHRYPPEFSGGQRQRIGIARSLALNPKFVVCDEPVSALDVSIQSQILNLLADLQERFKLTYLFIAHDLNVVEHLSDRVAVMYLGQVVELASSDVLYEYPRHPYSQALLSALPIADPTIRRRRIILTGEVPSAIDPPPGCRFATRCPQVMRHCRHEPGPPWVEVAAEHWILCWLATSDNNP
ncbi:MAG: dipeptide ABC transporter ATP-binding protein [Deltaproteobacteria bacterium]|nr:dipeptide ABC transporter ATP-binding protein [Deltaproteobacteria bacterium]MBW1960857.1 dipeptide ABC transporter ATP-binding protein [Deltaproteobacteria bacterium]MBW2150725.1 dipeptide ABC transporter ATP-binding protein [Deltaproteobacteria bacterium]